MDNNRNKHLEEILGSLDGSQRAAVPDFFFTRLKARMLARLEGGEKGFEQEQGFKKSWLLRPAFAITALAVVLLINTMVILKDDASKDDGMKDNAANDVETLQSIAAEYSLNDNNPVYDLNQDK